MHELAEVAIRFIDLEMLMGHEAILLRPKVLKKKGSKI